MLKLSFFLQGGGEVAAVRLPGLAVRALRAGGPHLHVPSRGPSWHWKQPCSRGLRTTAILAQLAMDFTCLAPFNQPCCRQKGKGSWRGLHGAGLVSSSLMQSPDGINFSALQNSIKTFQFIELEKKRTY